MDPLIELPEPAKARIKAKEAKAAEQFDLVRRACADDEAVARRTWGGYLDLHTDTLQTEIELARRPLTEAAGICAQVVFLAHAVEYHTALPNPRELEPVLVRLREAVITQYGEQVRLTIQRLEADEIAKAWPEEKKVARPTLPPRGNMVPSSSRTIVMHPFGSTKVAHIRVPKMAYFFPAEYPHAARRSFLAKRIYAERTLEERKTSIDDFQAAEALLLDFVLELLVAFAEEAHTVGLQGDLTAADMETECLKFLKSYVLEAGLMDSSFWVSRSDTPIPDYLQARIEASDQWRKYRALLQGIADVQAHEWIIGPTVSGDSTEAPAAEATEEVSDEPAALADGGIETADVNNTLEEARPLSEQLRIAVCDYAYPQSLDAAPPKDESIEDLCRRLEAAGLGSDVHEVLPWIEEQVLDCLGTLSKCLDSGQGPKKCVEAYILCELDVFAATQFIEVTNLYDYYRFCKSLVRWCDEYLPELEKHWMPKLDEAEIRILEQAVGSLEGKIIGSVDRRRLAKRILYWKKRAIKKVGSKQSPRQGENADALDSEDRGLETTTVPNDQKLATPDRTAPNPPVLELAAEQPNPDDDKSETQRGVAIVAKQARALTVAKLIKELNTLKPQMFEDEAEYNRLRAQYTSFLTFTIADERPDLKLKVLAIRGSTRHIRLAQELAAARYGRQLGTIQDDWKDHKPPEFRRQV